MRINPGCIWVGLILSLSQAGVLAQDQTSRPKHVVKMESGGVCELNNLYIDLLIGEAKKSKERIFIISRLSKSERYRLNWRRLGKAHFFLTDGKDIPPSQILTAVSSRTTEKNGRLEFYLGSQLFLLSEAEQGKDVCLNCCAGPH